MRGTITSIFSSMRFAGVAAGPPVSAIMMKQHLTGMIFLMIGLSVAAAFLALKAIKPDQEQKEQELEPALE